MSFSSSSQVTIKGSNTFNHVQGNQVNNMIISDVVTVRKPRLEHSKFGEFEPVKRGHMINVRDLHSEDWDWKWQNGETVGRHKVRRTICTIEVYPDRHSKFTAVMYEGEEALKSWEEDFERFSGMRQSDSAQLFGINRSDIPALIFYDELIPLAHFYRGSIWMDIYIEHLGVMMGCTSVSLWMNTREGVLCRGPRGPDVPLTLTGAYKDITFPSTVDMLKDDVGLGFFSKHGSSLNVDLHILESTQRSWKYAHLDDAAPVMNENHSGRCGGGSHWEDKYPYLTELWRNAPGQLLEDTVNGLRFDTVYSRPLEAIARWPQETGMLWDWGAKPCPAGIIDMTTVDSGLIRFKLYPSGSPRIRLSATFRWARFWQGWLSQSLRIINAIESTTGEEDFFIVDPPRLEIRSNELPTDSSNLYTSDIPEDTCPIYLFLEPPPVCISELVSRAEGHSRTHFWSYDETGQSAIPESECKQLRLPMLTPTIVSGSVELRSWPASTYAALRNWQFVRGFDHTNADFARCMGYPEFEIIGAETEHGRFEEVAERRELAKVTSWWEAIAGSDISAFSL